MATAHPPDSWSVLPSAEHHACHDTCMLCNLPDTGVVAAVFLGPCDSSGRCIVWIALGFLWVRRGDRGATQQPLQATQELCGGHGTCWQPVGPAPLQHFFSLSARRDWVLQLISVIFHMLVSWIKYNFLIQSAPLCHSDFWEEAKGFPSPQSNPCQGGVWLLWLIVYKVISITASVQGPKLGEHQVVSFTSASNARPVWFSVVPV